MACCRYDILLENLVDPSHVSVAEVECKGAVARSRWSLGRKEHLGLTDFSLLGGL